MKNMILITTVTFLLILLPSAVDAALCTDNWEAVQAAISINFFDDVNNCVAGGSTVGCFDNALNDFNTASTMNDVAWAACCYVFGPAYC